MRVHARRQAVAGGQPGRARLLVFLCLLFVACCVTKLTCGSEVLDHPVAVNVEDEFTMEFEDAMIDDDEDVDEDELDVDSWADEINTPDAVAVRLTQRIQQVYALVFRLVASAKAEDAAFMQELEHYFHAEVDSASFDALGGMELARMDAKKSRQLARAVVTKLRALLRQLEEVSRSVGPAAANTVREMVREGQALCESLSENLTEDEARSAAAEMVQDELRKSFVRTAAGMGGEDGDGGERQPVTFEDAEGDTPEEGREDGEANAVDKQDGDFQEVAPERS
ncbi:hypothetical protein BESB_019230 [Besnoitia besnoiti]|uniref:Transmembrane protein n=1 Tax=Besnoitia besnoiti TaxID=94643 RepID=A0A2A9M9C1_BESBE|nr:hypothetical protein BESB_019230 [Besnoitia besnoiti]PFH31982.1 hypothetical protein BESB_019230 [Besnoitia besnoiti]